MGAAAAGRIPGPLIAHCTSMVGCTGVGFVIVHLYGVVCVCTPSYASGVAHACRLVCTVNKVKKGEEVEEEEEEEEDVLKALHGDGSRTFDAARLANRFKSICFRTNRFKSLYFDLISG